MARARKGEKFGDLARDNSDDPETAKNGGELPPYKRGQLRKEIEDIVFTQKKGYVTDPIRVPNGFLILQGRRALRSGPGAVRRGEEEITTRLAEPQMQPKVREFLTRLREDAFLEIREGYVDSGAAPGKDTRWKDVAQLKPQTTTKEEVAARRRKKLLGVIPHGRVGPRRDHRDAIAPVPHRQRPAAPLRPPAPAAPPAAATPPASTPAPK